MPFFHHCMMSDFILSLLVSTCKKLWTLRWRSIFVVILSRISVFSRQQSVLYHVFTLVGVQKCKWLSGCLTQLSGNTLHQLSSVS